jgi:hypothetical protein
MADCGEGCVWPEAHWVRLMHGRRRGVSIGRTRQTAIWWASKPQRRFLWRDHDSLYIAVEHLRLSIMKPARDESEPA